MTKVTCPNCGMIHEIPKESKGKAGLFESSYRRPYRSDAATVPLPQAYRETPVNMPTLPSHVFVPLYQSLIDGFFAFPVGVIGGLTLAVVVDNITPGFNPTNWGMALIGLGSGITFSFFVAGRKWPIHLGLVNGLLWVGEEIFQADFDGDGEIGEPSRRVEVEIQEKGIPREIETLEIDLPRLQTLAQLILVGNEGFSQRTAAKAGISRDEEWKPFRDKLIARRWARWNDIAHPKQGVSLQPKGEAMFQAILGMDGGQKSVGITHPPRSTHENGDLYQRFEHIER